jgi:hypothetical protein
VAIAHVQSKAAAASTSTGSSFGLAFTSNVTAGALLAAAGSTFNNTLSFSDSKTQAWTRDLSLNQATDAGFAQGHFANAAAGATTVTVTRTSGTGDISIAISEFSGVGTAGTTDGTGTAAGQSGAGVSNSITLSDAGSVIISGIATDGPTGTATLTNSFSLGAQGPAPWASAKMDVGIAYRIPAATGAYTTTWGSIGAGQPAVVGIMAFKPAGAAVTKAPPPRSRPLRIWNRRMVA